MNLSRRGFLGGLLAVVSAPAIVRVESLMPMRAEIIHPTIEILGNFGLEVGDIVSMTSANGGNTYLTVQSITREAVRLWTNSNAFIKSIDDQYDKEFAADQAQIGSTLRIRLPNEACA